MYHDYLNDLLLSKCEWQNNEPNDDICQNALIKAIVAAGFIVLSVPVCMLIGFILESL